MDIRALFSITATCIAVISYVPYVRDTWKGKTKPHAFSWFIWALLGFIAGAGQIAGGGGIGAMVAIVTATISLGISIFSLKFAKQNITRGDYASLIVALLAIPLWIITKGPLLSVILVSLIDVIGFYPTIRKSIKAPKEETLSTYFLSTVKHCLTIVAQERYNVVTVFYPASLALLTGLFVIMLIYQRAKLVK